MTSKITAEKAGSEFGQIMDRAVDHNDRFLVERDGEPAVLILSIVDYLKEIAPPPSWLKDIHEDSVRNGTDKLTMAEIDEEIAAARAERGEPRQRLND
jgi:hypothetical protein